MGKMGNSGFTEECRTWQAVTYSLKGFVEISGFLLYGSFTQPFLRLKQWNDF